MPETVIEVNNVSKQYRLGIVGTTSIGDDFKRTWARISGREDPTLKIGHNNILSQRSSGKVDDYIWALKDVSFKVKQGEVLGIIGKNGAGKSTLLKILSKVTAPTSGSVKIKGRIASLLEVGTGFHPELTGRENIFLNGAILGMSKSEINKKFDEIVDFSGIERYIDTPVKRYSSGMYVRLAFAVAAHLEPDILILDEVLAVGDAEFQKKCLGKMRDVSQNEGRTVIFVSHNLVAIQNLCKECFVLKNGTIIFQGNNKDAIFSYLNSSGNSKIPLKDRIDRHGNGNIKITDIEINDSKGNSVDNIIVGGEDYEFKFHYRSNFDFFKENILIGVTIKSNLETPVFLHHSRLNGISFNNLGKEGYFKFKLNKLPLIANDYILGFSVMDYKGTEYFDSIDDACTLKVVEGNPYNYTEIPPASHGFVLVNGKWDIEIIS